MNMSGSLQAKTLSMSHWMFSILTVIHKHIMFVCTVKKDMTPPDAVVTPHLLGSGTGPPGPSPPRWPCWGAALPQRRGLGWSTELQNRCRWEPAERWPPLAESLAHPSRLWPLPERRPRASRSALLPGRDPQWRPWSLQGAGTESLWKSEGFNESELM